ncbi:histone-like nucleoid-structuring protein Lsr2 [Actinomadura sp. DC4]|uniref:Lsr2 family DNA-binding protein n=1 Tax=Actinomadura sp. DC4 TaxID=3055069 RepID=UPI0025B0FF32|nr:histone-like nucleoid-structuring protein Lsr2 [Actinomadura sp. DC4]MDN3356042.1 Lsr2 family protein [Actinomadura sp. DC4]
MPEPKSYASEITEALLDGRTVKDVAQAYDRPRQQITALISRTDGWSLDPHTDTVVIGSQHDEPAASADVDLSSHDQPDEDDDFDLTGLERLLHRAEQSETAATRTAAEKARTAVDDLRERVRTEAAEAQIRDEISALEEKLAAARSQLKEIRPGKATARRAPGDGPTSKEVRAWAAEKGIECSPIGRVPQAIVDMYLAAKASA